MTVFERERDTIYLRPFSNPITREKRKKGDPERPESMETVDRCDTKNISYDDTESFEEDMGTLIKSLKTLCDLNKKMSTMWDMYDSECKDTLSCDESTVSVYRALETPCFVDPITFLPDRLFQSLLVKTQKTCLGTTQHQIIEGYF